MAPMAPSAPRSIAEGSVNKEENFRLSLQPGFAELAGAVSSSAVTFQGEVAANGGWLGGEMPWSGAGTFAVASGRVPAPDPALREVKIAIRVEAGIPVDPTAFADAAMTILNDPRGWGPIDRVSFARIDDETAADIVITLASPATTELLCGELPTRGYTSCGRGRPVNINGARWVESSTPFRDAGGSIEEYRRYVINHEVGHSLGHPHEPCLAPGSPAPVMMQQTLDLGSCSPNGWPSP